MPKGVLNNLGSGPARCPSDMISVSPPPDRGVADPGARTFRHRPDRSLDQRGPLTRPELSVRAGPVDAAVERTDVLGGLIHECRRAA
jgi:hypothetical protein